MKKLVKAENVIPLGKTPLKYYVRTTKSYWKRIKQEKHIELIYTLKEVKTTLTEPNEIRRSLKDDTIHVYYKKLKEQTLVCVVKILNGVGFVVTAYQTNKPKPKGDLLWPS